MIILCVRLEPDFFQTQYLGLFQMTLRQTLENLRDCTHSEPATLLSCPQVFRTQCLGTMWEVLSAQV